MKYSKTLIFVGIVFASTFMYILSPGSNSEVYAVDGNDFKPGRIMDDAVFFNYDSMSVAEIQKFLDSKMPNCDTNHAESSHWKDFGQPYICLKDYREDPTVPIADCTDEEIQNHFGFGSEDSRYEAAKNYCWWKRGRTNLVGATAGSSSKSAARIIWEAAQEHRINPQVLIVTLQKEQSLLTDDYPWVGQYQKAMGYACPDTAACDPQFRGFYNQVHNAARQFRRYVTYPERYNHAVGDNHVRYHPNSSCGGSRVNIVTQATAAFYNYTPYQPNAASLNSYPGTGDSCSSYGNRNFWFKFNEWFGPTIGTPLFRFGNNDGVYILGSNNDYYHIPNRRTLEAYGFGSSVAFIKSVSKDHVDGRELRGNLPLIARFEGDAVYIIDQGQKYHFTSREMLENFGYLIGDEALLPDSTKHYYHDSDDVAQVVKNSKGHDVYFVEGGKKSHIIDPEAYASGDPPYNSRERISLSLDFIKSISTGAPIMTDNKLLYRTDSKTFTYWDGVALQDVSKNTVSELALSVDYSATSNTLDQLSGTKNTLINKLVKDSSENLFILDQQKRYPIDNSQAFLENSDLSSSSFVQASSGFLSEVPISSSPFVGVFRVNNNNPVFIVKNGSRHHINDPNALSEQGFTFAEVVSVNSSTSSLFDHSKRKILSSGSLYRIGSHDAVYFVNTQASSLHVPTMNIFKEYGFSLNNVSSLSKTSVENYPAVDTLDFLTKDGAGKVWFIHAKGSKRLVSSELLSSEYYDMNVASINSTNSFALKRFTADGNMTEVLRATGTPRVYKIEKGKKRWIASRDALASNGYTMDDVIDVPGVFIHSFPTGEPIN